MIKLAGTANFQWKTSEQIWPFEKTENGDTLYCQHIELSALTAGVSTTPTTIDPRKVFDAKVFMKRASGSGTDMVFGAIPFLSGQSDQYNCEWQLRANGDFTLATYDSLWPTYFTAYARVIYWK